ncbi:MAG: hypothetical protein JWQ43_1965 [Glaciihabitans sp.]|nr:hypothetical protein [Glaciihabitans sp.]
MNIIFRFLAPFVLSYAAKQFKKSNRARKSASTPTTSRHTKK